MGPACFIAKKAFLFHPFLQGLLFYALVDGDNIDRDDYGKSGMLGQIITYKQFCSMTDLLPYDILIAACVGRDEMGKPWVALQVS